MPGTSSEKIFSDVGLSRADWEKQIPNLLAAAGLQNDEPMAVVQSKERFAKYREFVEENFKRARGESSGEDKVFSSEEAKTFVEGHNKNLRETRDFEDAMFTKITISSDQLLYDDENILCVETEDGLLRGVMVDHVDEKSADIFIKTDNTYQLTKPDGKKAEISGAELIERNNEALSGAAKNMRKGR